MQKLTDLMLTDYHKDDLECFKETIVNYIVDLNYNDIEWKKMNITEMTEFFCHNYNINDNKSSWLHLESMMPIGMSYIYYPPYENIDLKFFIGAIKNRINKETIVGAIIYNENCDWYLDEDIKTFISFVEINFFYQGMGLLDLMFKKFVEVINKKKDIVMTIETEKGKQCGVMRHLKKNLNFHNYQGNVYFDYEIDHKFVNRKKLSK